MARAVVILGAGSSADFGVPTLANIFKDRYSVAYLKKRPGLLKMLNDTFWYPRGHKLESSDQSLSIEQMLTLLRDWEQEEDVPEEMTSEEVTEFRKRLYVLLQQAVFEGKDSRGAHLNPLIDICRKTFDHVTWATFNWDCIFESSFWYSQPWGGPGSRVNPKLAIKVANWHGGSLRHTFLKLHGGINWWLVNDEITYYRWSNDGPLGKKWEDFDNSSTIIDTPVILEPSVYKYADVTYSHLGIQWQAFFDELKIADCVIIVGYSLPELDAMARSKILTAFQVNEGCDWLVVDQGEQTCNLYRRLLGTERAKILPMTLAGFNNDIRTHLQEAFPDIAFVS